MPTWIVNVQRYLNHAERVDLQRRENESAAKEGRHARKIGHLDSRVYEYDNLEVAEDYIAARRAQQPDPAELLITVTEKRSRTRSARQQTQLLDLPVQVPPEGRKVDKSRYRKTTYRRPDDDQGPKPPEAGP